MRKVWKILLILQPVGNGASPGGKMEYGKRGRSAQESFWEISSRKLEAGAKCEGWRVAEETGWSGQGRVTAPLISCAGHDPTKHRQE